jgi:hypothetical protein
MGPIRSAAVLLTLLALSLPGAGWAVAPVAVDARQLARTVDAALAVAAQAAKEPKAGLDPRNPRQAAFLAALQGFQARVRQIEDALAPRNAQFFLLVDQGSSDLGELRVAWARSGARNDRIAESIRTASSSYRLLRANFGREAVRRRQGGALTDAERQQFQRLQGAEQRFAASLQALRDKARQRGDATSAAELERFRAEAESLAQAAADLSTYLNALIATSELRGEWHANVPYIRKSAPTAELAAADETVQDLYVDADIGQVFTVDLGAVPAADGTGAPVPEASGTTGTIGTTGKVEVYQAASEEPREAVVVEPIVEPVGDASEAAEDATGSGSAVVAEPIVEPVAEPIVEPVTEPVGSEPTAAAKPAAPTDPQKAKAAAKPAVPPPARPPIG